MFRTRVADRLEPALSAPCGFDRNGLPAAFQLVGRPFAEGLLLTDWHLRSPGA